MRTRSSFIEAAYCTIIITGCLWFLAWLVL